MFERVTGRAAHLIRWALLASFVGCVAGALSAAAYLVGLTVLRVWDDKDRLLFKSLAAKIPIGARRG